MTTYKYGTKNLSINNAEAFIASLSAEDGRDTKKSSILYAVIGNVYPWAAEPTQDEIIDTSGFLNYDVHRKFIGGKKINSNDVSHAIPRYDWNQGEIYSMYRDTDKNLFDRKFYVFTDEFNVYKCLNNNRNSPSTVKPAGYSTTPFTTSDGYTWKYMYTIQLGEAEKFLTAVHIPVKTLTVSDGSTESSRQLAVQTAAVNGSIDVVEVVNFGSGYSSIANGIVEEGGRFSIRISTSENPDPNDNYYNGSTLYVLSGTGAGQLRRIIDYDGGTKTFTVNTAFAVVCNTDSTVIVSPTLTIIGDGSGAKAYTIVDNASGQISNVQIIDTGSGYSRAEAIISSNSIHGSGATANVIISPVGGHGSDAIRELYGDKVILNVQFQGTEGVSNNGNGFIPSNTEFRTIAIIKDPKLKVNSNNEIISIEKIANTSNSPQTLRLTHRLVISYNDMNTQTRLPVDSFEVRDIVTNQRNVLRATLGQLEFVTELSPIERTRQAVTNAVKGANGNIVFLRKDESTPSDDSFYTLYLTDVDSYGPYPAFTKDDVLLSSQDARTAERATVESIKGPEANTYSSQVLYIENVQAVTKSINQVEDIKIILDF